jgi:MFS family permease
VSLCSTIINNDINIAHPVFDLCGKTADHGRTQVKMTKDTWQKGSSLSVRMGIFFSALRFRNYRLYWFGHFSSVLSHSMESVAQGWLVLQLTNSPLMLGITGLTHAIPTVALTLLGGVIADRADRRRIMIFTQATTAASLLCLTVLITTNYVKLWHIMFFAFVSGCVRAFDRPSRLAILPQLIPKEEVVNAVALGNSIWQLNRLVGPASAGMLIYLADVGPTYGVCLVASLAAALLWAKIRIDGVAKGAGTGGILRPMLEGIHFIRANELYYTLIAMTFFNSVFGMSYVTLMPIFARDILRVGSQGFGLLQTMGGAGALGGILFVAYFTRSGGKGRQALGGAATFGLLLMGFALSASYPLSLTLMFFIGFSNQLYMTTIGGILQLHLPDQLRGRVMGIYGLAWELMPVGGMIAGTIAEYGGAPLAVAVGGFLVSSMAIGVGVGLPRVRRLE